MAASRQILAVDLGSASLKLGVFQADAAGSLTLMGYRVLELDLDPTREEERAAVAGQALRQGLGELGVGKLPTAAAFAGHLAFTRFVKLPPVAADQLEQMIAFEAQQNVPFPIHEVVWDHQIFGGGAGEAESMIVAIKSDVVEQSAAVFRAAGLPVGVFDVSPLALLNALVYNSPPSPECTLLIDVGARSTSLVFLQGQKVFLRSVPIGGQMITQNVSNEFQEPFRGSELLKKGKGFVGLGGAYADPEDPASARISKIARTVFSRLHAEINRSISFYRNQQGGAAPARVYLSGGGNCMAFSDMFFREKLGLETEYFNPLRGVAVAPQADRGQLSKDALLLGPLVGLALRMAGECPVEINLQPASSREQAQKRSQVPVLAGALAAWLLMFGAVAGANHQRARQTLGAADGLEEKLHGFTQLAGDLDKAQAEFLVWKNRADDMGKLAQGRNWCPEILGQVYQATASSVGLWITELDLGYNNGPVDTVPAETPAGTAKGKPAPKARAGAAENKPVNVAPKVTELNIKGFFESDLGPDFLNDYVKALNNTGLFSEIKILERTTERDFVALRFHLQAVLKPEVQPDHLP